MSDNKQDPKPPRISTRRLLIHGKVQGVWYRSSAKAEADKLGLNGWVRNLSSGQVEAVVHGEDQAIERFIDWAQQGPPAAQVARIELSAADQPEHDGFQQWPDA